MSAHLINILFRLSAITSGNSIHNRPNILIFKSLNLSFYEINVVRNRGSVDCEALKE